MTRWVWWVARGALMGFALVVIVSLASILHDGEWSDGDRYLARASNRMIGVEESVCWWKVQVAVAIMSAGDGPADNTISMWPTGAKWRRAAIERTPTGTRATAAELGWPWPIATSYETNRGIIRPGAPTQSDLRTVRIGAFQLEYPAHLYLPGLLGWIVVLGTPAWAALAAFTWCVATIRRRRRIAQGQCVLCGYSMSGIDLSRCPECGAAPSTPSRRAASPASCDTLPK